MDHLFSHCLEALGLGGFVKLSEFSPQSHGSDAVQRFMSGNYIYKVTAQALICEELGEHPLVLRGSKCVVINHYCVYFASPGSLHGGNAHQVSERDTHGRWPKRRVISEECIPTTRVLTRVKI